MLPVPVTSQAKVSSAPGLAEVGADFSTIVGGAPEGKVVVVVELGVVVLACCVDTCRVTDVGCDSPPLVPVTVIV